MNKQKKFQWGLFILLVVVVAAYPFLEYAYQTLSHKGWSTQFSEWTIRPKGQASQCDLSETNIFKDSQQRIWLLGNGKCEFFDHARAFDGSMWTEVDLQKQGAAAYQLDSQDRLWRLTQGKEGGRAGSISIAVLDNGKWSTQIKVNCADLDEKFGNVESFSVDRKGRFWLTYLRLPPQDTSAWTTGIAIFDGDAWRVHNRTNTYTLATERIYGPQFDNQSRAWFFSERTGVKVFDGDKWEHYTPTQLNLDKYGDITAVVFDAGGEPWMVTTEGFIASVDGKQAINFQAGLNSKQFRYFPTSGHLKFAFDAEGRLWVANTQWTEEQLAVFDGKDWVVLTPENSGLSAGRVDSLTLDQNGQVWLATTDGISVLNPAEASLPPGKFVEGWRKVRNNTDTPIGIYWLFPFFIFVGWFVTLFCKPRNEFTVITAQQGEDVHWLSALGLLFGSLNMTAILFTGLRIFIELGIGRLLSELLLLMLPGGVAGIIINIIALVRVSRGRKNRVLAVLGLAFSTIGLLLSGAGLLLLIVMGQ